MRRWFLGTAVLVGCAGGNALETTGAWTTLAPTGDSDGDGSTSDGGDTDGDETTGGSTSGEDTTSSGGDDTAVADSSSSSGADGSSSGGEVLPPQPKTGWWSHCTSTPQCSDDLVCMVNGDETDGACTSLCTPAGNPASCGASPGGTATPACLSVGANSICALDCSGGKSCPSGMLCLSDVDDTGPIEICM